MTPELWATLGGLSLIDSTSIGTLLLPIWFLLMPRVRVGRYLLYLATIALFYFVVGLGLLVGGRAWLGDAGADVFESTAGARVLVVLGAAMLAGSFLITKKQKASDGSPGRISRWRDRAMGPAEGGDTAGPGSLVALALLAGTLELVGMLPYLGAIGLLSTSDASFPLQVVALAGYCAVMVLPALLLLVLRLVARPLIEPGLRKVQSWMENSSGETTAWIVGIAGFLIARSAWPGADLPGLWSQLTG